MTYFTENGRQTRLKFRHIDSCTYFIKWRKKFASKASEKKINVK